MLLASSAVADHANTVYVVLAAASFVGAFILAGVVGFVIIRSRVAAANLALWKENAEALSARCDEQQQRISEQENTIHQLEERISTLTDRLEALSQVVTQASEIKAIGEKQDRYQAELLLAIGKPQP